MGASPPGYVSRFACGALLVMSQGLQACSLILDWNGYTGGAGADGGEDAPSPDAGSPSCTPDTCGGCCDPGGFCAGGFSATTCGTGGDTCQDCTKQSLVCSAGTCAVAPHDAAPPPPCNPVTCKQLLSCFLGSSLHDSGLNVQSSCCKTDGTCGCTSILGGSTACN